MASARLTLAQQLAQLEDPTPIDIDPEDEDFAQKYVEDGSDGPEEDSMVNGRAHYLNVEPSKLRRPHESLNEPKYSGKKITRQLGEDVSSPEEDKKLISEDESESSKSSEDEDEPSQSESDSEMEEERPSNDAEDLSNVLKKAKESDRAKGRAVARQMAIWDALIDSRIQLQKASSLCNTLPSVSTLRNLTGHQGVERSTTALLGEIILLSNDLFELREILLAASSLPTDTNPPPRKRRRIEVPSENSDKSSFEPAIASGSRHFADAQQEYHPHLLTTLQKWSSKIQAVTPSNLLPSSRNAFRTNKNIHLKPVTQLIEESLTVPSKLITRTRIRRGEPRIDAISNGATSNVDIEGKPLSREEIELFDDADFYQQLLRDVIDGQVTNGYSADDIEGRRKKVKKQVDTRASKGRKLRYEVHEKIANFMVPVPTIVEGWHEEKIDELFASLLGKRAETYEDGKLATSTMATVTQDGFRVFG